MFNNVHLTETRAKGGWCEIGVRCAGELIAVVTRPRAGAKWFVHFYGWRPKESYRSKEKAIAAAISPALTQEAKEAVRRWCDGSQAAPGPVVALLALLQVIKRKIDKNN